jgi:hypothetical protein
MGGEGCWSKTARGHPPVDVPQRHVHCCVHRLTKPRCDGALLDLAMVEARRFFQHASQ